MHREFNEGFPLSLSDIFVSYPGFTIESSFLSSIIHNKNVFFIVKIKNSPIKSHTNIYSLIELITKQLLTGPIKKFFLVVSNSI